VDNIKMDLSEVYCEDINWDEMLKDRVRWRLWY